MIGIPAPTDASKNTRLSRCDSVVKASEGRPVSEPTSGALLASTRRAQTSNNRNHAVPTTKCEYSSDFWSPVGIREAFFIGILFVVICLFTLRECKKFCILRRSNVESSEQVEDRTLEMMAVVARPATKDPEVPYVKATKVN